MPLTTTELAERNRDIFRMFQNEQTLQAIGEKHNLTRERVRQIVKSMDLEPRTETHKNRLNTLKNKLLQLAERYKNEVKILSVQNVVTELGVTEYIARKLFRETGLHIEFPHRFTREYIYRTALKVKNGMSIAKASNGDHYLANLVGEYCRTHNIPVRYSRWQDLSDRRRIVTEGRASGKSWRKIADEVSVYENRKITGSAVYQWAKNMELLG